MNTVTVVIATFNSARTLRKVLESVRRQTYPKDLLEVLAVDGGSQDETLALINEFQCRLVFNPQTEPSMAKKLGFLEARGKYVMYLDADEVLENADSIVIKVRVLQETPNLRMATCSGYLSPPDGSFINHYLNEYGDPFSFFIYRLSRADGAYVREMKRNYAVLTESDRAVIFDFRDSKKLPLLEVAVFGTLLDLDYIRSEFPVGNLKALGNEFLPHLFYHLIAKSPYLAIMKNDPITHHSGENISRYLSKIRWRVKNNIFFRKTVGATAFIRREELIGQNSRLKALLFIPYSISIIFPLWDALVLCWTKKNIVFLIHVPLCLITTFQILYYQTLRMIGFSPQLRSYDETKLVE